MRRPLQTRHSMPGESSACGGPRKFATFRNVPPTTVPPTTVSSVAARWSLGRYALSSLIRRVRGPGTWDPAQRLRGTLTPGVTAAIRAIGRTEHAAATTLSLNKDHDENDNKIN